MREPMTLDEIAKAEGVSRQAIADLLNNIYRKIRWQLRKKGIKKEDLI